MDEFWAIVLGAALATLGGIIGTLFSNSIEKRKEQRNRKTEAYVKTLNFLHKVKFKKFKGNTFDKTSEIFTILSLYATDNVKRIFGEIMTKIVQNRAEKEDNKDAYDEIEKMIDSLSAQMKIELNMDLNISDMQALKTIIEDTEVNNAN